MILLTPLFGLNGQLLFGGRSEAESPLARFVRMLVAILALGLGVHRVILASAMRSFLVLPPGAPMNIGLAVGPLSEVARYGVGAWFADGDADHRGPPRDSNRARVHLARSSRRCRCSALDFAVQIIMGFVLILILLPDEGLEVSRTLGDTGPMIEHVLAVGHEVTQTLSRTMADSGDKTEAPTPERRRKAREDGQFARSK